MQQVQSLSPSLPRSARIGAAVELASRRTGVDFSYLVDVARVESGFDASAQAATSSARGLYQFTRQTWLATLDRHGDRHGLGWAAAAIERDAAGRYVITDPAMRTAVLNLRDDPAAAAVMAGELTAENRAQLLARTGREPEPVDLYLAHFLGAQGAAQFLAAWTEKPDQPAAALMPTAAAANRGVFFDRSGTARSLDAIRERFRAKLGEGEGGLPAAEFRTAAVLPIQTHDRRAVSGDANLRATLPPLGFEPMPRRLSLQFAADSYRRLAALTGGGTGA